MKILTTLFAVCGSVGTLLAQNSPPPTAAPPVLVSTDLINRLVAEARTNNPSLKAADSRVRSAAHNAQAVRTWDDPTFMFGGNVFSPRGFTPYANGDLVYGLQEKLPLWGIPKLNRHVAAADMSTRQAQAEARFQQLRQDIIKALVATALSEQIANLDEQDLAWLNATSQAVDAKYRAGQVDVADTLHIQNAAAVRTDQLQTDRLEVTHNQFDLNRLLNRRHDSPWPSLQLPPVAPPVPYSARLLALALANEPNLKVVEQEFKQANAAAKRTQRARLPNVGFGVEGWQYSGDGGFRQGMFTLSVSLPWINRDKYREDYDRDREFAESVQQEREDRVLTVREELHHYTVMLDAARRAALLYQNEIYLRATQALADKLSSWESGKVPLREVLDAHRDALDAQLMAIRATSAQYQTMAELLLWTGLQNFESLAPLALEPPMTSHDEPAGK